MIIRIFVLIVLATVPMCHVSPQNYSEMRNAMVENQIKARGINDTNVLNALLKVERHIFVPPKFIEYAYDDGPLQIGEGQTISQPYIVAYMTQALKLNKDSKVLEIGTGSGYQAAILAEIAREVYSVEIIENLGIKAEKLLTHLGYQNIHIKIGDGYMGWQEHAPFDGIIVTCAPTHVPEALKEQLAEGGIMIIPVGQSYSQELVVLIKNNGKLIKRDDLGVRFVPMMKENGGRY